MENKKFTSYKGIEYKVGQLVKPNKHGLETLSSLENKVYIIKKIEYHPNPAGFVIITDFGTYDPYWFELPIESEAAKVLYGK